MSLDKDTARFDHGKRSAIASTMASIEVILRYQGHLRALDVSGKWKSDIEDWLRMINANVELPEYAYDKVQNIYDAVTSKAFGLQKVPRHIDRKRKGLRF